MARRKNMTDALEIEAAIRRTEQGIEDARAKVTSLKIELARLNKQLISAQQRDVDLTARFGDGVPLAKMPISNSARIRIDRAVKIHLKIPSDIEPPFVVTAGHIRLMTRRDFYRQPNVGETTIKELATLIALKRQ